MWNLIDFERYIERIPFSDCWYWVRARGSTGYGRVGVLGKNRLAHRVIYEQVHGPIQHGIHVLHKCDNPSCVNPDHLFLGTHSDNMNDMARKGRSNSKLSKEDVIQIRKLRSSGYTLKDIADEFNVTFENVHYITINKTWKFTNEC